MKAVPGDRVRIVTKDREYEGIFMPNEETDAIIIKLSNGYNVGIKERILKRSRS
jgi:hypothetical protein